MDATERTRFNKLYTHHLRALKLQGMRGKTIDSYVRAVRRLAEHFDCSPERLTTEQLEEYFAELIESHSWSTVKVDRNGLQFFWKHVLKTDWQWVNMIKPPELRSLPAGSSHCHGGRTIDRSDLQASLQGVSVDDLFHGFAPE